MTIIANSTNMKERIWINRVAIEAVSFPLHNDQSKQHEHEGAHLDQSWSPSRLFLTRCMTIKANSTNMKERIWINRVAIEAVSFPVHNDQSKQHEHEGTHLDQS